MFYATYIFGEIPSNLILKKVTPAVWLPCLAFLWGIIAMSTGFIKTFGHFIVVRALLGYVVIRRGVGDFGFLLTVCRICEGGLLPGMVCIKKAEWRCRQVWRMNGTNLYHRFCIYRVYTPEPSSRYELGFSILLLHFPAPFQVSSREGSTNSMDVGVWAVGDGFLSSSVSLYVSKRKSWDSSPETDGVIRRLPW